MGEGSLISPTWGLSLGEKTWRVERVSELLRCHGAKMGFEDEVGVSGGQSQKGIQGKAMAGAKALRQSRAGVCGVPTCSGVSLPRSRMGGNFNSRGGW